MTAAAAPIVVGVTGHRDLVVGEIATLREHVHDLLAALQRAFPACPLWVLSPLAAGSDQLVAEVALELGAKLVAPLPLARDLYSEDFAVGEAREHFDALCARAQVIELPLVAGASREGVAEQGEARTRQYAQAGVFVARHCHLLIALWDGKRSAQMGGTAQIVEYYLNGRVPGNSLNRDEPLRLYGGGDERELCHLVCSRDRADGAPAHPLAPGQMLWLDPNSEASPGDDLPDDACERFMQVNEFNLDVARYDARIVDEGVILSDGTPADAPGADGGASTPAALFRAADWLAMHFQRRVLLAMRMIYLIAFVMGVSFEIYNNLTLQAPLIYLFLFLFALGVIVSTIAKRRDWQRKYLDYRALAESLRVQCYLQRAGVAPAGGPGVAHDSLMQKQDAELGWVRNVARSAGLDSYRPAPPDGAQLDAVIAEWVGDATHGELGYYERRTGERERTQRHNEAIGTLSLLVGIVISLLLAILAQWLSDVGKNELMTVMAVFAIFAGVREAYSFRKADRELIRQYRLMQRVFINAHAALRAADDTAEQRAILLALGEAALTEHVQWAVMHRQRPLEAGKMG